ncbi:ABC transporter, ATP-binding protein [Mobiluncus mulieris 28-1]|uniref:ABC transporter, ATP-binding protein n=2 Tax=Mobiluncus mulieris TaxID=2052 RepID=E0QRE5_9ACTO|nr:ABC transporter ATP-binding protein [Mobiluncus mulieris]EEZ91980.1 ABC transporter, ATP-binding protein [Mobiluncus mulieris 28-1]EFM45653.1 ABC transporter, ATP-binding protein [Mobiluncus mulieris ATCC 35239]EFN93261.1 ABC transporter, ATP-binding protein [Mobiluncus mulieris FB024-16]MBB5846170.1 thiamine transport system ATP-binding protein [Mobiluncus mulieris]MCU9970173.1 ABC transporter ATP-binding protein [Mobiluncus mulieris]
MVSKGLRVHEVQFAYPPLSRGVAPIPVLKNVSLELEPGQVMVLLGSSGCGKSTLLQVISGLLKPDSGTIAWDNQDLKRTPVHRRGFAMLFQGGELFPGRDVAGNIAYGLEMRRPRPTRAQREARVAQMLRLVHLEGYENRGISTLSGGQAGRVALARALAPAPRLLLLDEPLAALDEQLKYELARDIREILKASDSTALYVTHDQSEAKLVADRVSIMHQGEIVAQGSLESLRRNPPNPGIAKFLGL